MPDSYTSLHNFYFCLFLYPKHHNFHASSIIFSGVCKSLNKEEKLLIFYFFKRKCFSRQIVRDTTAPWTDFYAGFTDFFHWYELRSQILGWSFSKLRRVWRKIFWFKIFEKAFNVNAYLFSTIITTIDLIFIYAKCFSSSVFIVNIIGMFTFCYNRKIKICSRKSINRVLFFFFSKILANNYNTLVIHWYTYIPYNVSTPKKATLRFKDFLTYLCA